MTSIGTSESGQSSLFRWILPAVVTLLALADGALHLSLDFVLFRGNLFGAGRSGLPPGPPPGRPALPPGGGPPQLPLPLNELFLLNFVGYVVLALLFWFAPRWLGERRWLLDLVMVVYAVSTFFAWWEFGRPNPMGLGYISKGIEFVLIVSLVAHIWGVRRGQGTDIDRIGTS
jgi:hypothetical protein